MSFYGFHLNLLNNYNKNNDKDEMKRKFDLKSRKSLINIDLLLDMSANPDKCVIITHEDLDGYGSAFLLSKVLKIDKSHIFSNYNDSEEETLSLIRKSIKELDIKDTELRNYYFIFIDRSINIKEILNRFTFKLIHIDQRIGSFKENGNPEVIKYLLDNYSSKVSFYYVNPEVIPMVASSIKLTYELLNNINELKNYTSEDKKNLEEFVDILTAWDSYSWKMFPNGDSKRQIYGLMAIDKMEGTIKTYEMFNESLENDKICLNENFKYLLSIYNNKYKEYLNTQYDNMVNNMIILNNYIGVVYDMDSKIFSLLSNRFLSSNPNIKIISNVFPNGLISLREHYTYNKVNLQKVASKLEGGGGGHFSAAGGKLYKDLIAVGSKTKDEILNKAMKFLTDNINIDRNT